MNALAQRLVACNRWRWMPGMRYSTDSWRTEGFDRVPERMDTVAYADWLTPGRLPDLSDPGTLGCLLALVREAWGLPGAYFRGGWIFNDNGGSPEDDDEISGENGMSEAEALVAALEAAP